MKIIKLGSKSGGGDKNSLSPRGKKVGGHVPSVPYQIAPMCGGDRTEDPSIGSSGVSALPLNPWKICDPESRQPRH